MAINKPKSKPSGTDSVSKKQSFQEWAMAGGGVPLQYKGREHVWDRKVKQYAEGGDVHMQVGGISKLLKAAKTAKEAPAVVVPSRLSEFQAEVAQKSGQYGAKRLQRAADEVKNIERLYKPEALRELFLGDNAKALVTMNPADFEKFAKKLEERTRADIGPKAAELAKRGQIDKYTVPTDEYIQHLMRVQGGFDEVPYLTLYKDETGLPMFPNVRGHEGRHRSRALAEMGEPSSLVNIYPSGGLREELPRRSREEFIEALRKELDLKDRMVIGEDNINVLRLPDIYAEGGEVGMQAGGISRLLKSLKGTQEVLPAAQREANLQKMLAESKTPMRLYHGTTATEGGKGAEAIRNIRPSKEGSLGSGTYLTPKAAQASGYSGIPNDEAISLMAGHPSAKSMADQFMADRASGTIREGQVGGNMLPVYAQIKNPLVIEGKGDPMIEALIKLGIDEDKAASMVERAYENKGYIGKEVESRARAAGYDGLMQYRDGDLSEVVSYKPGAVKSAIGNKGTYDTNKPDLNEAAGGDVHMDKGGAAFGVFPQMKPRRSKQDPEAAKNVPVDLARGFVSGVLGAPGDIESFARLPYELITGKDSPTFLPTSEDIEKRLPFRSEAPVSRAASGAGQLAGGFYLGPGSPLRAVGALPGAIKHGAQEFAKASAAAAPRVIKPKGGNWLTGSIEKNLKPLKTRLAEAADQNIGFGQGMSFRELREQDALNQWIDRNLTSYVKNEMATPQDPVRLMIDKRQVEIEGKYAKDEERAQKMADRAAAETDPRRKANLTRQAQTMMNEAKSEYEIALNHIFHIAPDQVGINNIAAPRFRRQNKTEQLGISGAAKAWEDATDVAITPRSVKELIDPSYQKQNSISGNIAEAESKKEQYPWLEKLDPESKVYSLERNFDPSNFGFDHIMDVLRQDVAAGRIAPEQLSKVSMEQAVRRTSEFDQEMAKKMREAQIKMTEGMPVHKEYPEGYKWIELAPPKDLTGGVTLEPKAGGFDIVGPNGEDIGWAKTKAEAIRISGQHKALEDALKYEGETMGHCVGGYCPDVLEGKSRIFSLRDAKGEPHVTVEAQPHNPNLESRYAKENLPDLYAKYSENRNKYFNSWPEFLKAEAPELLNATENKIVQIKGKQNRAPNEQYLPFVQDFVRGGKWSDVGDLGNTGLYSSKDIVNFMPESFVATKAERDAAFEKAKAAGRIQPYMTRAEWEDALKSQMPPPTPGPSMDFLNEMAGRPPEGMKAGGPVKMARGGAMKEVLKKLLKPGADTAAQEVTAAERAAAGRKAAELIKSQPPVKASEALGQAMEKGFKKTTTTQADRTRVGGGNIGGAPFSAISEVDPAYAGKVWGVMDEGTAARLKNLTDPETAWTTMLGSANQLKTNPIVFDKLKKGFLESMKAGNLSPELEAKINHNLALTFGEGAQIRDPKIWKEADTFEKRAALADLMMGQGIAPGKGGVALGGEKSGKGVIFKPTDILKRETEPGLLHPEHGGSAPTFAAGPRLFKMDPMSEYRPDLHPGFPTLISGKDLGVNMIPTPTEVYLPEWHSRFKKANPDRKGPGYYDLALGVKGEGLPSQELNNPYIRHLIREGFKAGGTVSGLSTVNKLCGCHD
jgi:hypothetical protein